MARCFGDGDPLYAEYHDTEWGVPPEDFGTNEAELFERLTLEVFQVGLSWLLILRRREAFRELFHGFDPELVAQMSDDDVERLAANGAIIRNRAKIKATIRNAQAVLRMHADGESLAELFAAYRPQVAPTPKEDLTQVPATTPESEQLTKALKQRGFSFVGPTNVYAMMQALGIVNDHVATCPVTLAPGSGAASAPTRASTALNGACAARDIWDEVRERTAAKP